jgi:hypothetical protein
MKKRREKVKKKKGEKKRKINPGNLECRV